MRKKLKKRSVQLFRLLAHLSLYFWSCLLRAPLAGLWLLQKRLWLWLTRWSHFFRWAKAILKNHLAKRLIGCFSERPLYSLLFIDLSCTWLGIEGRTKKNNLDWWEGYCAKMTWAEAGWATFFGSCPLVHFGKALHWWSHLKKRCLAQLLHEPEPKLKNKPYQRGPNWSISFAHVPGRDPGPTRECTDARCISFPPGFLGNGKKKMIWWLR